MIMTAPKTRKKNRQQSQKKATETDNYFLKNSGNLSGERLTSSSSSTGLCHFFDQ